MSQGIALPLETAHRVADRLMRELSPACERIAIAGSIRRRKPEVRDIELVAVPRYEDRTGDDLWGTTHSVNLLDERLQALAAAGTLGPRVVEVHRADGTIEESKRDGRAYKALRYQDMPVDLFIVHPGESDWGVIYTIRTGPADWSQRLVTDCQRYLRRVQGGKLYRSGKHVPCPEEEDFFAAIGQRWIDPPDRTAERVRITA